MSVLASTSEFQSTSLIMTSHSIDGTFESCPRRFEFMHVYLKAPEYESDAYAADVGTAIHEGTQEWQRRLFAGASESEARAAGEYALLLHWPWLVEQNKKETGGKIGLRTLGNALLVLNKLYDSEIWENWELVEIEGFGPAIEVPWRIIHKSLGLVPTPYGGQAYLATQGKIDFILRHKTTGRYRVFDIKTTEKEKPVHDGMFRFSGQAGQYGIVLEQALGLNWQANGLEVTYLMALFDEEEFEAYPLHYKLDAEEVQDSIDVKLERLIRMRDYAIGGYWPRRAHGCEFYGRVCGFLDICSRRDKKFVNEWFEFEQAAGRFTDYKRIYEPVWVLEA